MAGILFALVLPGSSRAIIEHAGNTRHLRSIMISMGEGARIGRSRTVTDDDHCRGAPWRDVQRWNRAGSRPETRMVFVLCQVMNTILRVSHIPFGRNVRFSSFLPDIPGRNVPECETFLDLKYVVTFSAAPIYLYIYTSICHSLPAIGPRVSSNFSRLLTEVSPKPLGLSAERAHTV